MFIKQIKCMLLLLISGLIITPIHHATSESVFPTQSQQVNLLTNVHEIFREIKNSTNTEQMAMDRAMKADMELILKRSRFTISLLQELTLLKLISRSNAVCVFDAKETIYNIAKKSLDKLAFCAERGSETMSSNSQNLTLVINSGIKGGEEFLQKLNSCSEKRGLGVVACYTKIIQNDVLPVKTVLSDAINHHRNEYVTAFALKAVFNECTDETVDSLKLQLELALEAGLNCT